MDISVELSDAEAEALKRAFPDTDLDAAASMLLRAEMERKYRLPRKAAVLAKIMDRKVQKIKD